MTKNTPTTGLTRDFGFIPFLTPERLYFTHPIGGSTRIEVRSWDRQAVDPSMGGKYTACIIADSNAVGLVRLSNDGAVCASSFKGPGEFGGGELGERDSEYASRAVDAVIERVRKLVGAFPEGEEFIGVKVASCVPGWRSNVWINNAPGSRQIRHAWAALGLREGSEWPMSSVARTGLLGQASQENIPQSIRCEQPYVHGPVLPAVKDDVDHAEPTVETFEPDTMTHGQLVDMARYGHTATAEIARAHVLASDAQAERDVTRRALDTATEERDSAVKRADLLAPKQTAITYDGDTCEVLGVTLPSIAGDHGPTPSPGYDLEAWRAEMKITDLTAKANAAQVAKAIFDGDSVRLVGPPSVGKTSGIREVCALTGAKFFLVPCGEGATDLSLIAERTIASDRSMKWVDGHVTAAVRWAIDNPSVLTVAVLDEVDHLPAEVQSLMHGVLEGGELVVNPEETLRVPSNMRFTCTANTSGHGDTSGRHQAAKVSDTAFTSRWNATFTVTYLPRDAEIKVLVAAGASLDDATAAVRAAEDTRTDGADVSQPIVLRQLLAFARACGRGEETQFAWCWRVLASLPEHDRPAMREITRLKFGW